uniref:Uncharacterized protein n=1 Tax=Tanacetum cinerariifolium TaxID=118510 RepID=A0A6L2JNH1_TANCI|nr:hypothetical protein [Tanacetum cinerariifolium]
MQWDARVDLVCSVIVIHLLIMSGKATLTKLTISNEVTSPDNHMSATDRRLNIMSGGGTSSKKATLDEPASAKDLNSSDSPLFLDELQVGVTGIIFVMLCRIWDVSTITGWHLSTDMVVFDAHEEYCIRKDDAFMLEFNGATSAQKSLAKDKLYSSSSSSTQIFDDPNISVLKAPRSKIRPDQADYSSGLGKPRAGTLENLLLWARNRRNDSIAFICQVKIDNIRTWNGWNFPMYRLESGIFDVTAHVVVVMFDETTSELVKCSSNSLAKEIVQTAIRFNSFKTIRGETPIRQELEDSKADSLPVRAWGKKKQRVSKSY